MVADRPSVEECSSEHDLQIGRRNYGKIHGSKLQAVPERTTEVVFEGDEMFYGEMPRRATRFPARPARSITPDKDLGIRRSAS